MKYLQVVFNNISERRGVVMSEAQMDDSDGQFYAVVLSNGKFTREWTGDFCPDPEASDELAKLLNHRCGGT